MPAMPTTMTTMKMTHCQWEDILQTGLLDARMQCLGGGTCTTYQPPPPLLESAVDVLVLVEPSELVDVLTAPSSACTLLHMLLYQLVMLPKSAGVAVHAASQGPAVAVEKATRRVSEQKHSS